MSDPLMALVDGSAYSESVCHHAAWIAGRTGAQVKLYHVLDPRRAIGKQDLSGSIRLGARSELLEKLTALDAEHAKLAQARGRAILEDAREIIAGQGVSDIITRLRNGDIVETVTAKDDLAGLVLIGKRGEAAGLDKPQLGSNFERIVRASSKPVFVANRAFTPINRVLIAYDGGSAALKTVDYVARDPLFAALDIHLASVGPQRSEADLAGPKSTLAAGGHAVHTHILSGEPSRALSTLIDSHDIHMLAMGAYGHSRIRALVLGSTTAELITTCKVPIVLMR